MNEWERAYWDDLVENLPVSPESDCSYFPDRPSCMRYFFSDETISPTLIDASLESGFRRCGDMWYRTQCPACQACQPYRIPVDRFAPSRNMSRLLARNRDVQISWGVPEATDEKQDVYLRYQHSQHHMKPAFEPPTPAKPFDSDEALEVMDYQMYCNPESTREVTMYLGGDLIGFGIMDVGIASASLVYFVFDPAHEKRSLGTLNILVSIDWAAAQTMSYVYLGYYISDHPKMSYKKRFRPAEILREGQWVNFPAHS